MLAIGTAFGALMGWLIQRFRLQPFIVTLAGMFLARGPVLPDQHRLDQHHRPDLHRDLAGAHPVLGAGASITVGALIALARWSRRHLARARHRVRPHRLRDRRQRVVGAADGPAGARAPRCSSTPSAASARRWPASSSRSTCSRATACTPSGLELDAIAAVVIGGTLLSGGVGYVAGTLFGVLILGIIQTLIAFDGSLSSWWTRIVIGALLFVFCLLQRAFEARRR